VKSRFVSPSARQRPDRGGDPLDGLVNLFDLGIVLSVGFLALVSLALTGISQALLGVLATIVGRGSIHQPPARGGAAEKLNLPIISLPHCSLGLIDFAEPVREFHMSRTKKFIDLAKTWQAKNVLLVLGEYIWQREVIPPAAQWQWGIETCRRLGDYAERKNVDIALELEPFRLSLLNNVDAMARFIDEFPVPGVSVQNIRTEVGDIEIRIAIVVVVADGHSHAKSNSVESGLFRHIHEVQFACLLQHVPE